MAKKEKKEQFLAPSKDMTLEEAKAYRASLAKDVIRPLSNKQKRQAFKIYWAQNKRKYGMTNRLEEILWLHLVSTKNDEPSNFDKGLANFGIKKI